MSIRTPLARARGLGSAKDGTHHWWMQRVTSVALVPLVLWFTISVMVLVRAHDAAHGAVQSWLGNPVNAGLMIALLVAMFYHAKLGAQVIIEDYVHPESAKIAALLVVQFLLFLLGAIAIVAVLKIALA
jgi:succinate dehydrogenase / fumarate reductase, membrane anchor subunit